MNILLTIVALLIVLGIVVFVHELGHFLAARWAGVRVDTFSIGFGPAILKWHDKRGTLWKLACLPLGGYVSIYGQEDMFNRKKFADLPAEKKKGHYLSCFLGSVILELNVVVPFAKYLGILKGCLFCTFKIPCGKERRNLTRKAGGQCDQTVAVKT